MFLRPKTDNHALGLMAAYAVLIVGIIVTGSLDAAPAPEPIQATEATLRRHNTQGTDDCSFALQCRSDAEC